MEKNGQDNNGEFTFVQEKIKSRWKKRLKRMALAVGCTLVLALIFGLVARLVFIKSEKMFYSILGIDPGKQEAERGEITFPSPTPKTTPTLLPTPTAEPVTKAPPSPTPAQPTPTTAPEPTGTDDPEGQEGDTPKTALNAYIEMMKELRGVSEETQKSLLTVTTVTTGINWMDEGIEITEEITGVIMGDNNVELLILVCYDEVDSVDRIELRLSPTLTLAASVYNYDREYNVAVLAVPLAEIPNRVLENMKPIELGESSALFEGMPVIALGCPNGYNGSVEYGFVTATGAYAYLTDGRADLFYTDITNNEGSDGIIVDLEGKMIGLITHTLSPQAAVNASTAVGVNCIKNLILCLLNDNDRPYFGIKAEDIPTNVLERMELANGIYINEVIADSPAASAGLKKGDVITGIGGDITVYSVNGFASALSAHKPGDTLEVHVYRSGSEGVELKLQVTLKKREG